MDIYYMKQDALDLLKANMDTLYKNYFTQYSIDWFYNFCKENDITIARSHFLRGDWETPCPLLPNLLSGYAIFEILKDKKQ